MAVKELKSGPIMTQTSLTSTGWSLSAALRNQWIQVAVSVSPGYTVPPTTRPRGYHVRSSKKFQKASTLERRQEKGGRASAGATLIERKVGPRRSLCLFADGQMDGLTLLARQLCHPVIEVRVELVDHGLVFDDTEQPDRKSNRRDENEGDRLDRRRDPTLVLVVLGDLGLLLIGCFGTMLRWFRTDGMIPPPLLLFPLPPAMVVMAGTPFPFPLFPAHHREGFSDLLEAGIKHSAIFFLSKQGGGRRRRGVTTLFARGGAGSQ